MLNIFVKSNYVVDIVIQYCETVGSATVFLLFYFYIVWVIVLLLAVKIVWFLYDSDCFWHHSTFTIQLALQRAQSTEG